MAIYEAIRKPLEARVDDLRSDPEIWQISMLSTSTPCGFQTKGLRITLVLRTMQW